MDSKASKSEMKEVGLLPNGCMLYCEPNEVGGHRYWSDEVGGGVCVWDTSLVDISTLLAAIVQEQTRIRDEYNEQVTREHLDHAKRYAKLQQKEP